MKTLVQFLLFLLIALLAIVLGVILGDYAPWYFAWLVGTVMLVLVSAAGGAWLDTQEAEPKP
jgi:predicted outer membrane lipoprotein